MEMIKPTPHPDPFSMQQVQLHHWPCGLQKRDTEQWIGDRGQETEVEDGGLGNASPSLTFAEPWQIDNTQRRPALNRRRVMRHRATSKTTSCACHTFIVPHY